MLIDAIVKYLSQDDGYFGIVVEGANTFFQFFGIPYRITTKEELAGGVVGAYALEVVAALFFSLGLKEMVVPSVPRSIKSQRTIMRPLRRYFVEDFEARLAGEGKLLSNLTSLERKRRLLSYWDTEFPGVAFNTSGVYDVVTEYNEGSFLPAVNFTSLRQLAIVPTEWPNVTLPWAREMQDAVSDLLAGQDSSKNGTLWFVNNNTLYGSIDDVSNYGNTTVNLISWMWDRGFVISNEKARSALYEMNLTAIVPQNYYVYKKTYESYPVFLVGYGASFIKELARSIFLQDLLGIVDVSRLNRTVTVRKQDVKCYDQKMLETLQKTFPTVNSTIKIGPSPGPSRSLSPSPSLSPSLSPSRRPSPSPSLSPSGRPSPSLSPSRPSPSPWPSLSFSPTIRPSPSASNTPFPSDSPSASDTPFPSDSPSASDTPFPSDTPSASDTPFPSDTPSASDTPFPSDSPSDTPFPSESDTPFPSESSSGSQRPKRAPYPRESAFSTPSIIGGLFGVLGVVSFGILSARSSLEVDFSAYAPAQTTVELFCEKKLEERASYI